MRARLSARSWNPSAGVPALCLESIHPEIIVKVCHGISAYMARIMGIHLEASIMQGACTLHDQMPQRLPMAIFCPLLIDRQAEKQELPGLNDPPSTKSREPNGPLEKLQRSSFQSKGMRDSDRKITKSRISIATQKMIHTRRK